MAIPLRTQPALHILGSGNGRKPFDLDHAIYSCHFGARFVDLIVARFIGVSGQRVVNLGYRNPSTSEIIMSGAYGSIVTQYHSICRHCSQAHQQTPGIACFLTTDVNVCDNPSPPHVAAPELRAHPSCCVRTSVPSALDTTMDGDENAST